MECEIDRQIGAAAVVMRSLYWSVVVKSWAEKPSSRFTGQSTFLPSPMVMNFGLWRENKIPDTSSRKMSFLCRVAGRSLRDMVRSSVTWEELGIEPLLLLIKRSSCPCSDSCPCDLAWIKQKKNGWMGGLTQPVELFSNTETSGQWDVRILSIIYTDIKPQQINNDLFLFSVFGY